MRRALAGAALVVAGLAASASSSPPVVTPEPGRGGLAAAVQQRRTRPSLRPNRLLAARSILWIAAHPDDEVLVAPLLGELCRAQGRDCTLLIATRGEAGTCALAGGCGPSLGAVRSGEAQQSALFLGARLIVGDLPDGSGGTPSEVIDRWGELSGGREALLQFLVSAIVASGADTVVTFDPRHGTTCHPDHRAIGRLAADAAALLGDPTRASFLLETAVVHSTLTDGRPAAGFVSRNPAGETTITFDGAPRWDDLLSVAAIHASQFRPELVEALSRAPAGERLLSFVDLRGVRSVTDPDLCRP